MADSSFSLAVIGTAMPVELTWPDLAIRLVFTFIAGAIIGSVVGLCFGGGQMLLGWLATAIGVFVLSALRWFENFMSVERHASLALTLKPGGPSESEIRRQLEAGSDYRARHQSAEPLRHPDADLKGQ